MALTAALNSAQLDTGLKYGYGFSGMRHDEEQAAEEFREQCRRQMERPLDLRIWYGFYRLHKPVLDDAPWRLCAREHYPVRPSARRNICKSVGSWPSQSRENRLTIPRQCQLQW